MLNKKYEREILIDLIKKSINLNIDNCVFMKKLYKNSEQTIKTLNKSIRQSKKALELLPHIKHIEILRSIYGDMVGKLSGYLMLGGTMIVSKKIQYFDNTEKGFKEFTDLQEQIQKDYNNKLKEQRENAEAIKKAKEEGKKVEYMVDPITKKLKPVVVEEENKA